MSLPIDALLPELLALLEQHTSLVLQAPPGAGKTTRVPPALLNAPWLQGRKILLLEPRRIAARAAAGYMAGQRGEAPGQSVGFRTRLETRISTQTRIEVVTEGILVRMLQSDPALDDYGIILFDEFHERSLQADLGLALARESQQALREDLRLLVMSATLDAAPVARLLGDAPMLSSAGRAYPVEIRYAPVLRNLRWQDQLLRVIHQALAEESGSLLVFLPGTGDIRRIAQALQGQLPPSVRLAPLYGNLSAAEQDRAITPAPAGERKLVLATSIAETSLTIDGVRVVIDAGWQRLPVFDPNSAMTRLVTRRVSAAAAEQRRGRAGRTQPGVCYRLWSETEQQGLAAFTAPEIREADLTALVLELAQWGARDSSGLIWLDPPPASAWNQGRALLQQLQALDADGAITAHGQAMLSLGLSPRLAHLVLRGRERGLGRLAAELASLLGERDLLGPREGADLHHRLLLLRGEAGAGNADRGRLRLLRESVRKLLPARGEPVAAEHADSPGELLALAYPDRVARRRPGKAARYQLSGGRGALLTEEDALGNHEWLVAAELDGQAREARIFLAAPVSLGALEQVLAHEICEEDQIGWDEASESVVAKRVRRLGALVLSEKALPKPDASQLSAGLLAAVRQRGLDCLPWQESSRQWLARVRLLQGLDSADWPKASDEALLAGLEGWLAPYLGGCRRLADLQRLPLQDALDSLLSYAQQQTLQRMAPQRLAVPTGSQIPIDYVAENGPVLAVKLQELFGLTTTPCVANGRVPLLIHLLSPARRPLAVTRDLASFWQQAYPEVRKDMRGRYPRHPWPEDPLSAPAQRGTKQRPA